MQGFSGFVNNGGFSLGAKGSLCVCSFVLYRIETWPINKGKTLSLEKDDTRMVR